MQDLRDQLVELLNKAETPTTGRKVSCVLIDEGGEVYQGYNIEKKGGNIHAEEMALQTTCSSLKLKEIHLMANGSLEDIKHALPCSRCQQRLVKVVKPTTKIVLHSENYPKPFSFNWSFLLGERSSPPSFKDKEDFFLRGPLTDVDKKLLSCFCSQIERAVKDNVQVYITGTASGVGGPKAKLSVKILGNPYHDLDLILIFPNKYPADPLKFITDLYKKSLEQVGYISKPVFSREKEPYRSECGVGKNDNFLFRRIFWADGLKVDPKTENLKKDINKPSMLDISVGKKLESVITDKYWQGRLYFRLV